MTLGEMIKVLEATDRSLVMDDGLGDPHSYRGYYECLAFEPKKGVSIGDLLDEAKGCIGRRFHGYKGGEYLMTEDTDVYRAHHGETGEEIGPTLLGCLITIAAMRKDPDAR